MSAHAERLEPDREEETVLERWAGRLASALVASGVREAVVSPGSRSTPFLLALARQPALQLFSVVDERAAGFFALGLARVTGRPPCLLCTSGTAPAHYYPAVIEASEAGLPLVVLSADRPHALMGSGAPQTTDQLHLFGRHARLALDLGDPSARGLDALGRQVASALAVATGPDPGPVQLNARADKPLEPRRPGRDAQPSSPSSTRVVPARLGAPPDAVIAQLAEALDGARRPALVAGPMSLAQRALRAPVASLNAKGVALFAECGSQLRLGHPVPLAAPAFDLWLPRCPEAAPDLVIELGGTPTSSAYARWLESSGPARRFVLAGARPRDPQGTAEAIVLGDPLLALEALARASQRRFDARAARGLLEAEARAARAIEEALSSFGEAAAVRRLARALPAGASLALGNSLPIRHADRALGHGDPDLAVLTQRGVNGIDGGLAGAAGASLASGRALGLVLGDVALAHDATSLAIVRSARAPLVVMVLDNGGGRIFEQLPIAKVADAETMRLFTTPPEVHLDALAAAYGVPYARAEDTASLDAALAGALARDGATLLHVVVPPHGARELEARMREAL